MSDADLRFHEIWLGMVQPTEGLVVSIPVLVDAGCAQKQPAEKQAALNEFRDGPTLRELHPFLERVLGYTADLLDGHPTYEVYVPEGRQTLRPTLALRDGRMLIWELPRGLALDKPEKTTGEWHYPPAEKFDRLLRAAGVPVGLLTNLEEFRLVYAPRGESSGSITFRVKDMGEVAGRPIFDAFVMLLSAERFFSVAPDRQLPELLKQSRQRQANVTNELADQVFAAIGLLLRGFEEAAERDGNTALRDALERGEDHVYGGLLAVLLRIVFVLYAEDRGLLPIDSELYESNYSILGLHEELSRDKDAWPDTMSRRFGAWPRMLALFRAIFAGNDALKMPPRRGELFDPEKYPFLEGWSGGGGAPFSREDRAEVRPPTLDDGTVLGVLEKLLVLEGQRLSYRVLDVEQIGSVYEALMGYHVRKMPSAAVCIRSRKALVWAPASELFDKPAAERAKHLEQELNCDTQSIQRVEAQLRAARTEGEVLASLEPLRARHIEPVTAGRLVLQPGAERRRTSSHYTPRSLSSPIVKRTLEPLLAAMGDTPASETLLNLKVCDPAMGSGAFLVEACRLLADQIVAAWTREGRVPAANESATMHARRLVAQRCLYGVDKNPFAVSLAKLSMWLVTLAKEHPFTFLDHALKHGDSLVGLSLDEIRSFHWGKAPQLHLAGQAVNAALKNALTFRGRILELASDESPQTVREKERLHAGAQHALEHARIIGDLCVGAFFAKSNPKERERERVRRVELLQKWLQKGGDAPSELLALREELREQHPAFHWMLEFPEVFYAERPDPLERGNANRAAWMDAFLGNPPFANKNAISGDSGTSYIRWLQNLHDGSSGNADLCAHFFRRAHALLGKHGAFGFVATKTISEGDTRTSALQPLVKHNAVIYDAVSSMPWPGDASVTIATVHVAVGGVVSKITEKRLDGRLVPTISSRLDSAPEREAERLRANAQVRFSGSKPYGEGFLLSRAERDDLVRRDPRNDVLIKPYVGGDIINGAPGDEVPWIISFGQMSLAEAERWPELLQIVRNRVKPDRDRAREDTADGAHRKKYWWQFAQPRPDLYAAISSQERCLVVARDPQHICFSFQPTTLVFNEKLTVIAIACATGFGVLQSRVHIAWATFHGRMTGGAATTSYSSTDVFDTFAFPGSSPAAIIELLEKPSEELHKARSDFMSRRLVGLTATYNLLRDPGCNDPEVGILREAHVEMDRRVLAAYKWTDIAVPPYTVPKSEAEKKALEKFEDDLIDRLFVLNAERAKAEAVTGHASAKAKGKRLSKTDGAQSQLALGDD